MGELRLPTLSDELVSLARERTAEAHEAALDLTAVELMKRGSVDLEGEPSIGVFPIWTFDEEGIEPGEMPFIDDLEIRLAEPGEDDQAPTVLYPFRLEDDTQDGLAAITLAILHLNITRRLSGERPLAHLSDEDLAALEADKPNYSYMQASLNDDDLLERWTLSKLAKSELKSRSAGTSSKEDA